MTTISQTGIIYIRQNGANIQYSTTSNFMAPITIAAWPVTVTNTTLTSYLKVYFTTDITLTGGTDRYFICGSDYIQFGNTTLNANGTRPAITIQNIADYPGLIQNGTSGSDGYSYIAIVNLNIISSGTTNLYGGNGWIGQIYYAKAANYNIIINCSSNGDIGAGSGGIVGASAVANNGSLTIKYCNSSGNISKYTPTSSFSYSGGIIGGLAFNSGTVLVDSCFTTGNIGDSCGGIFGQGTTSNHTAINCYSTGILIQEQSGSGGGGIFASNAGGIAINCYSIGNMVGPATGGIFGASATGTATNCYSLGNYQNGGNGGIFGEFYTKPPALAIYCYTSGACQGGGCGGIYAVDFGVPSPNNYSEYSFSSQGGTWSSANANTVLQSVGTIWGSIAPNTPYVLLNFGTSPYRLDAVDPITYALNQTFSQTVQAGQSTIPAQVAGYKTFQILSGGNPTITIDNTGKITTTINTPPGTYNLMIYGVDDYTTTTFVLTVTGAPEPQTVTVPTATVTPCCQGPVCVQASPTTNKDNELITTYTSGQAIVSNVDRYYTDIRTGARTFFVEPVFKSYREYMNYLQTKNRYV